MGLSILTSSFVLVSWILLPWCGRDLNTRRWTHEPSSCTLTFKQLNNLIELLNIKFSHLDEVISAGDNLTTVFDGLENVEFLLEVILDLVAHLQIRTSNFTGSNLDVKPA